jgi:hypothetical protein
MGESSRETTPRELCGEKGPYVHTAVVKRRRQRGAISGIRGSPIQSVNIGEGHETSEDLVRSTT